MECAETNVKYVEDKCEWRKLALGNLQIIRENHESMEGD